MSRCFPFPPPGYSGKCSSNEALILSIKLQREREKSNPDREKEKTAKSSERKKDRKKERKEKKREERRASSGGNSEKQKPVEKLYQADKSGVEPKGKCSLQEDEAELLEKSNVTEEHGRPYLQKVSSSTDSTGNSCKRKRPPIPPNGIQSNGNIIRICLSSSYKRDEPSTSGSKEQDISAPSHRRSNHVSSCSKVQPCSNIIRTEASKKSRDANVEAPPDFSHLPYMSNTAFQPVLRQDEAVVSLPGGKRESVVPKEKISSREKKLRKKSSKYNKLFDSWVPLSVERGLVVDEDDADDWLFGDKGEDRSTKRLKSVELENCGDNLPSCASSALQPRAHFIPDADIYALPFTVPF